MAVAASLNVVLSAQTQALTAGLNKARATVNGFAATMNSSFASVKQGFAIGAGFSLFQSAANTVRGGISSIFDKLQELNKIGQDADKLGISSEVLQGFRIAAKDFSIDKDQLNNGLQKVALSAKVTGSTLEEKAFRFADALAAMSPSERLIAGAEVFGERNTDLIKVFSLGSAAIRGIIKEGKELGGIASDDKIRGAQLLDDQMSMLARQWDALKTKLAVALIPTFVELMTVLNNLDLVIKGVQLRFALFIQGMSIDLMKLLDFFSFGNAFDSNDFKIAEDTYKILADNLRRFEKEMKPVIPSSKPRVDVGTIPEQPKKFMSPAALQAGSVEAFSEINRLGGRATGKRVDESMLEELKKLNAELKRQNKPSLTLYEASL